MRHFVVFVLFLAILPAVAAQGWAVEADPISDGSWCMIILPDTQHYSELYPDIYNAQTQWIADHKDTHNIKMVVHEGDITDNRTWTEFGRAKTAMNILSTAGVPYSMCVGNHDRDGATRETLFDNPTFFGPGSAYASQTHFQGTAGGFYAPGKTGNSWCTFNAGGEDWLIFSVEYGPSNEMVTWMDTVAAAHPNHNLILNTHAYLYYDNTRYDYATYGTSQTWTPHGWVPPDSLNDGQELWDKLVKKYPNWKFVLSGHVLADGTGWLGSVGDHGNLVQQLLINYQMRAEGGEGYLRIMEFKEDGETVKVSSYSPHLGSYLRAFDHDFTINMNEMPTTIHGVSAVAIDVASDTNVWTAVGAGPGYVQPISPANLADVSLAVAAVPMCRDQGMMMATVRQNVRDGYYGTVEVSHLNLFDGLGQNVLQIATSKAADGGEANVNVAAAFFPFTDGWIAGHVAGNGTLLEHYGVAAGNVSRTSMGRYMVSVDNIDSQTDGMLFAVSGENGFNFLSTAPLADGSGWEIATRDNTAATFGSLEDNRWSFVYVDYDAPGLVGGRIAADASIVHHEGDFTVVKPAGSTGVYRITIPGYMPEDGVLLLTVADTETNGITAPDDNIIAYEASANTFVVTIRDRNGSASPLEDGAFVFAFLAFDKWLSPAVPGDANYDGQVDQLDADIVAGHWGQADATWAMGDFNLDGLVNAADAAIVTANWGFGAAESGVPEPSIAALLGGAIVVLVLARRRRAASIDWTRRLRAVTVSLVLGGLLLPADGCGNGEVQRHSLSGRVTYQGKPLPAGMIVFEPDARQGNQGPQGYAKIVNGRYQTDAAGKGVMIGALSVEICGFPSPDGSGGDPQIPLFAPYRTIARVSQDTATLDFDVPDRR